MVIDTNIFVHAANPRTARFGDSVAFLVGMRIASTDLAVDEHFSFEESKNRSSIGREYHQHVRFGSVGYSLLALLASTHRVRLLPPVGDARSKRLLRRLLPKAGDRLFASVAAASFDRMLISHDDGCFSESVCQLLEEELGVRTRDASEALDLLQKFEDEPSLASG